MNELPSVIRAGALVAALMALDAEFIPVSGDTPKLEVHWDGAEENAPGVSESFQLEIERNGVSYLVTLETNEADTRLPISAVAVSGSNTSTSTATGTLSVAALPIDVGRDSAIPEGIPPNLLPELGALAATAETNERLPVAPVSLSGTNTSSNTGTGTLSTAGTTLDVSGDTEVAQSLGPDPHPWLAAVTMAAEGEVIPVSGTVEVVADNPVADDPVPYPEPPPVILHPEHELPVSPVAFSGTASSTSTASGTLGVTRLPADDEPFIAPTWPAPPEPLAEEILVKPVALSGSSTSTGTATGTLSVAGVTIQPQDYEPHYGPERDATASILAAAEGEVIPVSGAAPGAGDAPPSEDDSAAIAKTLAPAQYHGPYPEHELPISPRALSGTATSTTTATGTVSVTRLPADDTPHIDPTYPAPPAPPANDDLAIKPVSISGTATSTSTSSGTLEVAGTSLDVTEADVASGIAPETAPWFAALQAAADSEVIPVSGEVAEVIYKIGRATYIARLTGRGTYIARVSGEATYIARDVGRATRIDRLTGEAAHIPRITGVGTNG